MMENKYTTILVDDEEGARNVLSNLLATYCPQIKIIDKCEDVEQAVISIKKNKPDLVFLDIEMPNYSGYEITSFFEKIDFEIIFVTAYDHYAVKAFEISALDYILKPIDIDRLKESITKFENRAKNKNASVNYQVLKESLKDNTIKKIVVPFQGDQKVLLLENIIAIEASESYSVIHTINSNKIMVSKNLKHFEKLFESNDNLLRTHKSWIVNSAFIKEYSKSDLTILLNNRIIAKLSKYKKQLFEAALSS